jgi:hypothetical protein
MDIFQMIGILTLASSLTAPMAASTSGSFSFGEGPHPADSHQVLPSR